MQALRTGRVNHAYLFSGPRGCGKTTSARILARCLNCELGPTPTPCGVCDSCVALARGGPGTIDVIEIDAASHGGVDDARELRERAAFGPAQSRYKIYIIDEAHMVTSQGFNALLKIVEEPPEHVKFIFATTEPEKVIGTIRSRTHHYPFRLVPPGQLTDYLDRLCQAEQVTVEPGVLSFVVRAGGGSVRDSLSVLDQLIAGSTETGLTYERAASILGFTDVELLDAAIEAFGAGDAAGAFVAIERVIETGLDPRRFVEDLLERFRDLIVVLAVPDAAAAVLRGHPADQLDRMRAQAAAFGPGALSRAADVVNAGLAEMTGATSPRLQLELIAARLLLPGAAGEQGYAARLDRLERRLDVSGVPSGVAVPPSRIAVSPPTQVAPVAPMPPNAGAGPVAEAPAPAPALAAGAGSASEVPASEASAVEPVSGAAAGQPEPALGGVGAAPPAGTGPVSRPGPESVTSEGTWTPAESEPTFPVEAVTGPVGLDTAAVRRSWPDILARVFATKRATWTLVSEHGQVRSFDGRVLVIAMATSGLAQAFRNGPHAEYLRQALIDVLGVDARIEAVDAAGAESEAGSGPRPVGVPPGPPSAAHPTRAEESRPDSTASAWPPGPGGTQGRSGPGGGSDDAAQRPQGSPLAGMQSGQAAPSPSSPTPSAVGIAAPGGAASTPDTGGTAAFAPNSGGPTAFSTSDPASATAAAPGAGRPDPAGRDRSPGSSAVVSAPPRAFVDTPSSWGAAPAGSAPSWATHDPDPGSAPQPSPSVGFAAAVAEPHVVDDSAVSFDDEDIVELGEVGIPVVERILGATIIRDEGT